MNVSSRIARIFVLTCWVFCQTPALADGPHAVNSDLIVTRLDDPAPGGCLSGDCSLREAIQAANNAPGVDTITFEGLGQVYQISIPGVEETANQTGDFNILDSLIIRGKGKGATIIDGGALDRVFRIGATASVTLTGMTIQDGNAPIVEAVGGGGVLNEGTLVLDDVEVTDNQANQGAGVSNSLGRLYITKSKIWENGSAITQEGGGVYSDGPLDISGDTMIISNTAIIGGGLSGTESADMRLNQVEISDNTALTLGGGIYNDTLMSLLECTLSGNQAEFGAGIFNNYDLFLESSTLDHNMASDDGGGLFNEYRAYLKNVTISANGATNSGGGVHNAQLLELTHVTFYQNSAANGNTLANEPSGQIQVVSSILAKNNSSPNCYNQGLIISQGYNLEDTNTCGLYTLTDKRGQNPLLLALSYDTWNTPTHALAVNSPALESGSPEHCLYKDQRGVLRPIDGNEDGIPLCDIGAYELATAGWVSFSAATQTSDEGTVATVIVNRIGTNLNGRSVSVNYSPITAFLWDFTMTPGVLTWGALDQTSRSFTVTILDDDFKEPDKLIELKLTNPINGLGIHPDGITAILVPANNPLGPNPPSSIYLPIVRR